MIEDEIPRHRGKKNTKRWCRGKVGKEHHPSWAVDEKFPTTASRSARSLPPVLSFRCDNCGKVFERWFGMPAFDKSPMPKIGSTEPLKKK